MQVTLTNQLFQKKKNFALNQLLLKKNLFLLIMQKMVIVFKSD